MDEARGRRGKPARLVVGVILAVAALGVAVELAGGTADAAEAFRH